MLFQFRHADGNLCRLRQFFFWSVLVTIYSPLVQVISALWVVCVYVYLDHPIGKQSRLYTYNGNFLRYDNVAEKSKTAGDGRVFIENNRQRTDCIGTDAQTYTNTTILIDPSRMRLTINYNIIPVIIATNI